MAPEGKYYHRAEYGLSKQNLGFDEEDMKPKMVSAGVETPKVAMPTERTCDKPVNQDGNTGKPFFKTLEARR